MIFVFFNHKPTYAYKLNNVFNQSPENIEHRLRVKLAYFCKEQKDGQDNCKNDHIPPSSYQIIRQHISYALWLRPWTCGTEQVTELISDNRKLPRNNKGTLPPTHAPQKNIVCTSLNYIIELYEGHCVITIQAKRDDPLTETPGSRRMKYLLWQIISSK